jgi:radical SAM protein with 4Fe4S-binding SPASM domain
MTQNTWLQRLFVVRPVQPFKPVASGLYHYMRQADGTYTRFHLRVELDGSGMLLANASVAARLSPTGVAIAKSLLDGEAEARIVDRLVQGFRDASRPAVQADLARVKSVIDGLAAPGDNYPIVNLDDAAVAPDPRQLIAPLNADVPLAEPERMLALIDRLWQIGIPHITVLVPPEPVAAHLLRAVERAEDTGMIAGARARASDLATGTLLKDLAQAGLDHVNVIYASPIAEIHDALCGAGDLAAAGRVIAEAHALEICPVAEIPLVESTLDTVDESLDALAGQAVTNLSFYAIAMAGATRPEERAGALAAAAMPQVAALVEEQAHRAQLRYLWLPPVQRDPALTLAEQVRRGARCPGGDLSVRVEPDGAVIPPRGPSRSAGNVLTDAWDAVWQSPAFREYRERVESPTRCEVCPGLAICAADCPREPRGWSQS